MSHWVEIVWYAYEIEFYCIPSQFEQDTYDLEADFPVPPHSFVKGLPHSHCELHLCSQCLVAQVNIDHVQALHECDCVILMSSPRGNAFSTR